MKLRSKDDRLFLDASRKTVCIFIIWTLCLCFEIVETVRLIRDPDGSFFEILFLGLIALFLIAYPLADKSFFTSEILIDRSGIYERRLVLFKGKSIRWEELEDYYFCERKKTPAGPVRHQAVFSSKSDAGRQRVIVSPEFTPDQKELYEKTISDYCEAMRNRPAN